MPEGSTVLPWNLIYGHAYKYLPFHFLLLTSIFAAQLIQKVKDKMNFTYTANPARVLFGTGTFTQLPSELARLSLKRPLVLSTPEQKSHADKVEELLLSSKGEFKFESAGQYNNATMHTPMHVTEEAMKIVKEKGVDCVIAIGGGSTTGLGKALAYHYARTQSQTPPSTTSTKKLIQIVIPTTYAGSEMTPILGQTTSSLNPSTNKQETQKSTLNDPSVLPDVVIYDVEFTMSLPAVMSATSGMNAIAHAVEALYAKDGNPVMDLMAVEGVRALRGALPVIVSSSSSNDEALKEARTQALYGAWLCATCLGHVGMSLHHKLCHVLGGTFNLPHAETHTIVLPHALAYNAPKVPDAMKKLSSAFSSPSSSTSSTSDNETDPIKSLNTLLSQLPIKRGLKDLGMPEEAIDRAADLAMKNAYWNPRTLEREGLREVIRRAWSGEDARADI